MPLPLTSVSASVSSMVMEVLQLLRLHAALQLGHRYTLSSFICNMEIMFMVTLQQTLAPDSI